MVNLLLDIGNSHCKCAEHDGKRFHWHPPVAVNGDDIGLCMSASLNGEVTRVLVASVRGDEFNQALADLLQTRFKVKPEFAATVRAACGVTTAYREAARLGVDRFLALIGAWRRVGGACVVADCGTAVTVDAINDHGVHQGGLIMPGLQLMQSSLGLGTDRLPMPDEEGNAATSDLFARDTQSAVANGCRRMFMAAVTSAACEMQAQLVNDGADRAALLVTGGDSGLLVGAAGVDAEHHPHLVLEGLSVFSEYTADCG